MKRFAIRFVENIAMVTTAFAIGVGAIIAYVVCVVAGFCTLVLWGGDGGWSSGYWPFIGWVAVAVAFAGALTESDGYPG